MKKETTKNTTNSRVYKLLLLNLHYPAYWDEGIRFHPIYKRGYVNPNKQIMNYQVRMYRTWKYNRKNQWKEK